MSREVQENEGVRLAEGLFAQVGRWRPVEDVRPYVQTEETNLLKTVVGGQKANEQVRATRVRRTVATRKKLRMRGAQGSRTALATSPGVTKKTAIMARCYQFGQRRSYRGIRPVQRTLVLHDSRVYHRTGLCCSPSILLPGRQGKMVRRSPAFDFLLACGETVQTAVPSRWSVVHPLHCCSRRSLNHSWKVTHVHHRCHLLCLLFVPRLPPCRTRPANRTYRKVPRYP